MTLAKLAARVALMFSVLTLEGAIVGWALRGTLDIDWLVRCASAVMALWMWPFTARIYERLERIERVDQQVAHMQRQVEVLVEECTRMRDETAAHGTGAVGTFSGWK